MYMVVINNLTGFRVMRVSPAVSMVLLMVVLMLARRGALRLHQGIRGSVMAGTSTIFTHEILPFNFIHFIYIHNLEIDQPTE
jgi:hypothetical protein